MNLDFRYYFSLFLRRLHYFSLFLAIGSAIGITLATVLPPVYRASAVLLVESEQIDGSLVEIGATEQLQIIEQNILTRERILEMANRLNAYGARDGQPAQRLRADEKVADMRRRISIVMTGGQSDNRRGPVEATIVHVTFVASNGALAAAGANEVASMIVEENIRLRTTVSTGAVRFARQQVRELDQQLATASAAILAFQEANIEAMPDNRRFLRTQQTSLQERLQQFRRDETILNEQRLTLMAVFEQTGGLGAADPSARLSPQERQLQEMQSNLAALQSTLSATHPRVRQLESQVAALQEILAGQQGAADPEDNENPQQNLYDLRMTELDGQLEYVREQQELIQTELGRIAGLLTEVPGNTVTLGTLQRDYDNTNDQYNRAVALLAQAELGDVIESGQKGGRIRITENAEAARNPNSPNRPVLAAAGIGGGMALGLAFIVLLELLNTAIRRPVELSNKLGITPLGTIPHIRTASEIARRRLIIGGLFALVLIAIPVILWLIHSQVTPLDVMLNRILNGLGLPLI